jgi:hypothetical protein
MLKQPNVHTITAHPTPAEDETSSIPKLLPPTTCDSRNDESEDAHWMTNDDTTLLPVARSPILLPIGDPSRNEDDHDHQLEPLIIGKMHPARIMLKDPLQGETGANCGATNDASILWYYKLLKKTHTNHNI